MANQLSGKVALITGAGSGIGEATARLFAQEGAQVVALDLKADQVGHLTEEVSGQGGKIIAVEADVSDPDSMQKAVQTIIDQFGKIDIVYANAGINGKWAPVEELEPEDWDRTLNINLKGTFLTVKYTVPHLKQNGGVILVTSSVNGTRTFTTAGASAYSSSKAAQVAFTKMIALELGKWNIRANVICPGAINTSIEESTEKTESVKEVEVPAEYPEGTIPLTHGQPGDSDQVAQLALFLASDAASHISGTEIWIDGAGSLLR